MKSKELQNNNGKETNEMAKKEEKSKGPVFSKQVGSIRAAVWEAQTSSGKKYHNVTLTRRFRDGDSWKDSSTLNGLGDCSTARDALQYASDFISAREDDCVNEME